MGVRCLALTTLLAFACALPPAQSPLNDREHSDVVAAAQRPLYGRFLHMTDFHPDPFYQVYSSTNEDAACHRGQGPAGIYGAETSECDSPIALVNKTMEWVKHHLHDIDFVVWTGDSARHDNDEELPRTADAVISSNEFMVHKMLDTFPGIPIVPTLGNNDILPHNVMAKAPNVWTRTYARVWKQFIPEFQRHQFEQGGWHYVEVIPNQLAVFSMNTLYFVKNNAAVDGCASPDEPGYEQLEWLRVQLQQMRERGVKVILIGHQPPIRQEAKTLWDETCWQKYTLWLRQYRDVIVTSMYGHFNFDHFLLQDFADLDEDTKRGRMHHNEPELRGVDNDEVHPMLSSDYWLQLRATWSELPEPPQSLRLAMAENELGWETDDQLTALTKKEKKRRKKYLKHMGGPYAERFATSFVSASVVPNLMPTLRVFEYNISGIDRPKQHHTTISHHRPHTRSLSNSKDKFTVPEPPSKSAPPGPAYSPQTLSLIKYIQYYANLTYINNDFHDGNRSETEDQLEDLKWDAGKHHGKKPHDRDFKPQPNKFKYKVQYDTREDDVYHLKDLTMPRIVDLARRIGEFEADNDGEESLDSWSKHEDTDLDADKKSKKHKKRPGKAGKHTKRNAPWYAFIKRAFVGTKSIQEIEDEFGY
ncbi:hypothetical protein BAUCODRAFT_118688 [Baudoinia panamericana UAMH 10762]|uniref:Endopolyphosphatase n=1 Tax=Baudoinia panamericana (strain UAMH 10762) TaxID=717646 RepID=M2NN95_BAUPA|nr:uncharacterized protein BAUCODRAFT_118688 [Baudoinia panamericana UAMH 10762]EMD00970.1 hypothetical protein BAUCODRAFT_118688 [Baudoinia panamericana UAMH 10762]